MNPEQALKILDQVCANTPANRQDHQAMSQALNTINNLIKELQNTKPVKGN